MCKMNNIPGFETRLGQRINKKFGKEIKGKEYVRINRNNK